MQLLARAQTISRKSTRSFQRHKSDLWRRCHSPSQASQSGHGRSTRYLYSQSLEGVFCRTIKYLTQLVRRQSLAQPISILECMDKVHKQSKTCPMFPAGLFDKIDAYVLSIKDNSISIVGKDTDAVFYGLTTLKHMLKESQVPVPSQCDSGRLRRAQEPWFHRRLLWKSMVEC